MTTLRIGNLLLTAQEQAEALVHWLNVWGPAVFHGEQFRAEAEDGVLRVINERTGQTYHCAGPIDRDHLTRNLAGWWYDEDGRSALEIGARLRERAPT